MKLVKSEELPFHPVTSDDLTPPRPGHPDALRGGAFRFTACIAITICRMIANWAPNFGLGLTKLTLFSQIRIPKAVQNENETPEPLNAYSSR